MTAQLSPPDRWSALRARIPGLALAVAVAVVATVVGKVFPVIGGPVTGIILGVALAAAIKPGATLKPGIGVAAKVILQVSVVLLGTQLSLGQIVQVGGSSLPVMLGSLTVCLVAAYWIGRWLGIVGDVRTLIGVGTGICGASAIAAVTPVIGAVSVEVAYAMSTIFLFNIAAVLAFPAIGHLLGLSQHAFGLFAGTAVNDMSSVVATASTYGATATNYAVVVKLTRTLLIIPDLPGADRARCAQGPAQGRPRRRGRRYPHGGSPVDGAGHRTAGGAPGPVVPCRVPGARRGEQRRPHSRGRACRAHRGITVSDHSGVVSHRTVHRYWRVTPHRATTVRPRRKSVGDRLAHQPGPAAAHGNLVIQGTGTWLPAVSMPLTTV